MSQPPDEKPDESDKQSPLRLIGQDLDRLSIFVKRAAALGAVAAFLHHLHCYGGH